MVIRSPNTRNNTSRKKEMQFDQYLSYIHWIVGLDNYPRVMFGNQSKIQKMNTRMASKDLELMEQEHKGILYQYYTWDGNKTEYKLNFIYMSKLLKKQGNYRIWMKWSVYRDDGRTFGVRLGQELSSLVRFGIIWIVVHIRKDTSWFWTQFISIRESTSMVVLLYEGIKNVEE